MSAPNVVNIMKSNAIVWVAPLGEAIPDESSIAAGAAWGGNWLQVGFTKEAVTVTYTAEEMEVNVEEHLAPIDRWKTGQMAVLKTVLAELTADYMEYGLDGVVTTTAAGSGQVGYEDLDVDDDARITKRAWGFEGTRYDASNNALPIRMFYGRATSRLVDSLEFSSRSDDYPGVGLEIKALSNPDDAGRLMRWHRVTAPAT